jgi:exportin-1
MRYSDTQVPTINLAPSWREKAFDWIHFLCGYSTDQQQQEQLIEKYMILPNQVWDDIINQVRVPYHLII